MPGFLCLNEHWMCKEKMSCTNILGYTRIADFCRIDHIHGGTVIFVRDEYASRCKNITYTNNFCVELDFECSALSFDKSICIAVLYRSPNGNYDVFQKQFASFLSFINTNFRHSIICGDLNVDSLKNTRESNQLNDLLKSYQLLSLINQPTRIVRQSSGLSCSAIDYIITNLPENTVEHDVFEPGLSDHLAQYLTWEISHSVNKQSQTHKTYKRNFNQEAMSEFRTRFTSEYLDLYSCTNVDQSFQVFWDHFSWCFNVSFPSKKTSFHTTQNNKNKITLSDDIKARINTLKFLNWCRKTTEDPHVTQSYKDLKKQINNCIKLEKKQQYSEKINNSVNKAKTMWQLVNEKLGKESTKNEPRQLFFDGEVITDQNKISNVFADYFANSIKILTENKQINTEKDCTTTSTNAINTMCFSPVTEESVCNIISNLPNKKSCGLDEVPIKLLKECCPELAHYLTIIINQSIYFGQFPALLKTAKIVPIYKKGDHQDVSNYRAISLLSAFSKVIEKAVCNGITLFLNQNRLLSSCQHGFREGFSTETATVDFIQSIHDELDLGNYVFGIFFDLSRAFDTINPEFLSSKLSCLGIRGSINEWVKSYVTNRSLKVKVGDSSSQTYCTNLGTPQGSIIGPLLFLLYVNDLPEYIAEFGRLFMYADDTTVVLSAPSVSDAAKNVSLVLALFSEWCEKNDLIINIEKTIVINFSYGRRVIPNFDFHLEGTKVCMTEHTKFLGTIVDHRLNFTMQVSNVCSKLCKSMFAISTLKNSITDDALLSIYYAQIYSVISYNIVVWGQAVDASRIFIIQKRIIRLIYNLDYRQSCRDTFKKKGLLTFISIYLYKLLCYIYVNNDKINKNSNFHQYQTRNKDAYSLNKCFHSSYKKSPLYAGCYFFNILPEYLKNINSLNEFKHRLKKFLIENCFYNLSEFVSH